MREILFYKTPSGQSPIDEFLDQLSAKQAQKIAWVLKLIEELEHIPAQYFRKMVNTEGLWEVRATAASNIFRLLGFLDGTKLVILTHAFKKKTQKPQGEP